jgi:G protein-coupled receptor 107
VQGGEYSLFYANCESHVVVSLDITAELYNEAWTGARDYLSAGEAPLPVVFLVMSILYFFSAAVWSGVLYTHRATTHKIHFLMLALVAFKALATMCEAGMYHMKRTTGSPDGWNIAFYIFSLFRGVLLFTVIVLLGTGWSFLKPFLSDREKRIIMLVLPVQVMANVADIILLENGPAVKGWFTWRDVFHLLDIICCCAILFPIVWSIKHLREAAHSDGKAARNLHKLTLFRQFYVMVVSYIYFTRIVVYLLQSTTPYQYVWLSDAAGELATLAFYGFTGYKFRPVGDNPYFHLEMDELDEAEQELVRREVAENAAQQQQAVRSASD